MSKRVSRRIEAVFLYFCAFLLLLFIVVPFLWAGSASFQVEKALFERPPNWIPKEWTASNYKYVFTGEVPPWYNDPSARVILRIDLSQEALQIPRGLFNSVIVAVLVTIINLSFGVPAAYTIAREKFRGRGVAFAFILLGRLLPPIAIVVPLYMMVSQAHMLDRLESLIVIHVAYTLPFTVWLLSSYFKAMPREVEESAAIDGSSRLGVLVRIVIPLAAPGLMAVATNAFLSSYNEFLFAVFTTETIRAKTLPVVIAQVTTSPVTSYTMIAVGVIVSVIPPMIIALIFRRHLTTGLASATGGGSQQ